MEDVAAVAATDSRMLNLASTRVSADSAAMVEGLVSDWGKDTQYLACRAMAEALASQQTSRKRKSPMPAEPQSKTIKKSYSKAAGQTIVNVKTDKASTALSPTGAKIKKETQSHKGGAPFTSSKEGGGVLQAAGSADVTRPLPTPPSFGKHDIVDPKDPEGKLNISSIFQSIPSGLGTIKEDKDTYPFILNKGISEIYGIVFNTILRECSKHYFITGTSERRYALPHLINGEICPDISVPHYIFMEDTYTRAEKEGPGRPPDLTLNLRTGEATWSAKPQPVGEQSSSQGSYVFDFGETSSHADKSEPMWLRKSYGVFYKVTHNNGQLRMTAEVNPSVVTEFPSGVHFFNYVVKSRNTGATNRFKTKVRKSTLLGRPQLISPLLLKIASFTHEQANKCKGFPADELHPMTTYAKFLLAHKYLPDCPFTVVQDMKSIAQVANPDFIAQGRYLESNKTIPMWDSTTESIPTEEELAQLFPLVEVLWDRRPKSTTTSDVARWKDWGLGHSLEACNEQISILTELELKVNQTGFNNPYELYSMISQGYSTVLRSLRNAVKTIQKELSRANSSSKKKAEDISKGSSKE